MEGPMVVLHIGFALMRAIIGRPCNKIVILNCFLATHYFTLLLN